MNPLQFTSQVNNSGTHIHTLIHMPMPALISISFAIPWVSICLGAWLYAALNLEEIVSHYDEHLWQS